MNSQPRHGIVVADTFNDDNDAIILGLTCSTEDFATSDVLENVANTILLNCIDILPVTISQVLGLELIKNKHLYKHCDFIEDVIDSISKEHNQEIEFSFYHLERIGLGRDWIRLYTKTSPDSQVVALIPVFGKNTKRDSLYSNAVQSIVNPILDQVIYTNPLAVNEYDVPSSVQEYLREYFKKQIEKEGQITLEDLVTKTTKVYPLEDSHVLHMAIERKLNKFMRDNVLQIQPLPIDSKLRSTQNVYQYLYQHELIICGNVLRYAIK